MVRMAAKIRGTITPAPNFNAERVAIKLQKAMKGMGTNEKVLIDVLTTHSNEQRQLIRKKYRAMYARDLLEDMKTELGGHFENVCIALLTSFDDFLVQSLNKAIKAEIADNLSAIDILLTLKAQEIEAFKNLYKEKFGRDLSGEFPSEMNEDLASFLKTWLNSARDEDNDGNNDDKVEEDTKALQLAVSEKSKDYLVSILTSRSTSHLQTVVEKLFKETDIANAIMDAFEAAVAVAYVSLLKIIQDAPRYFAERLKQILNGEETNDEILIRIVVSRSEIDLVDIKDRFKDLNGKDLAEVVAEETSGDYRKILLKIIG